MGEHAIDNRQVIDVVHLRALKLSTGSPTIKCSRSVSETSRRTSSCVADRLFRCSLLIYQAVNLGVLMPSLLPCGALFFAMKYSPSVAS